jgi:hypothetical protein
VHEPGVPDLPERVVTLSNVLYALGSLCFLAGTVVNMVRA